MTRIVCFLMMMLCCSFPVSAQPVSSPSESIEERVERFEDRFQIPLIYKDIGKIRGPVRFKELDVSDYANLDAYLRIFEEEMDKYPPSFFQRGRIRAVLLVKNLFSRGIPAQGLYSSDMRMMMFDIDRFDKNVSLKRHSVHHELYHMISLQTPGYQVSADPQWISYNPAGFRYGKHNLYSSHQNPLNRFAPSQISFVTDYAMTALEEDKAEVFACLMQAQHYRLVQEWQQRDAGMRSKVAAMKSFVAAYEPNMDENFWHNILR